MAWYSRYRKEQEKKLYEYQLKKFEQEEVENKKAFIKGDIINIGFGRRTLRFFNSGKATATNIHLEILGNTMGIICWDFCEQEFLNSQDYGEANFCLLTNHTPTLKVRFTWDDELKTGNENIQFLTL